MSFKLVVNTPEGPVVAHEISDRRVTRVSFGSRSGGSGEIRIDPDQTEVWVEFEVANPNEVLLEDLDRMKYPTNVTSEQAEEQRQDLLNAGKPEVNEGTDNFTEEALAEKQRLLDEANKQQSEAERQGIYDPQRSPDDLENFTHPSVGGEDQEVEPSERTEAEFTEPGQEKEEEISL